MSKPYIETIDARIAALEQELLGLKRAREIIRELMEERHEQKVAAVTKRPRSTKVKVSDLRGKIVAYFAERVAAVKSRDIIDTLGAKDSQVWKILADLRKEGLITYDLHERTYLAVREGSLNDAAA